MPTIFEYFGIIFKFYSNEHEPIHVHVLKGGCETIFELILENGQLVEIRQRNKRGVYPLSGKDLATAKQFVEKYADNIITKWINYFVLKKEIRNTTIKTKL